MRVHQGCLRSKLPSTAGKLPCFPRKAKPSTQPMNIQQLENELWEAADQLRVNSKLTAAEYSMPVLGLGLGLIFLRHADNRFKAC